MTAFENGYLAGFEKLYPQPALSASAVWLFELQRNAVKSGGSSRNSPENGPDDFFPPRHSNQHATKGLSLHGCERLPFPSQKHRISSTR